ncbi:PAS/PAC sensor signal transduction histidine kinase [Solidesulfovibrio fructosivorans JJ]]|uniref:histidine kinase n=1 Tax=Solidesulfovibrio fructosivorans JJ] TaxID=596151 RepID=E1JZR1_SOLFR|nr:PAS domain-containing protein [Solidesulfovibrio fructosivorans]EFL50196.1 PAS/PAC sensor signal transduction histidine kinase [Solidesulfovibrio fructosivorans JJ]]
MWRNRLLRAETVRREEAERALRAQHDLLETVFDATSDAILVLDQDFRVLTANRTAAARFDRDVASMRGRVILDLTEPAVAAARRRHYTEAMTTGRTVRFRDIRGGRTYDSVLYRLPGVADAPVRLAIYARDVTEELEAEAMLRESRERLDKIFHLTPAVIAITTQADARYIDINKTFTDMTGYTREDVIGRSNRSLDIWLDPKDRERVARTIKRKGIVRNMELRVRFKDGRKATGLLSCIPLDAYGEPCLLGVMMDITERKDMERELRQAKEAAETASKAKTRFLSVMSHEVRTPMNTILGMVDVLRDSGLTGPQSEYLAALEQAAESLLTLLEDVLTISRLDSGTLQLQTRPYVPADLARQAGEACAPRAEAKGLAFTVAVAPDVPSEACGDPEKICQVLDHLLDNAVKFTATGEVRLELARSLEGTGREVLRYSVIDTGVGIPPDKRQAVFMPFTLLDASTTRSQGGAGLGLALCALLATSMSGRVVLRGGPEGGSAFHFLLPVDTDASSREADAAPDDEARAWTSAPVTDYPAK